MSATTDTLGTCSYATAQAGAGWLGIKECSTVRMACRLQVTADSLQCTVTSVCLESCCSCFTKHASRSGGMCVHVGEGGGGEGVRWLGGCWDDTCSSTLQEQLWAVMQVIIYGSHDSFASRGLCGAMQSYISAYLLERRRRHQQWSRPFAPSAPPPILAAGHLAP